MRWDQCWLRAGERVGRRMGCSKDSDCWLRSKFKGRRSCVKSCLPLSSAWLHSTCIRLWLSRGRLCPEISLPAQISPSFEAPDHLSGLAKWGLGSQDTGALRQPLLRIPLSCGPHVGGFKTVLVSLQVVMTSMGLKTKDNIVVGNR